MMIIFLYIGPGLGGGIIAIILGIFTSMFLLLYAIIWTPLKRIMRNVIATLKQKNLMVICNVTIFCVLLALSYVFYKFQFFDSFTNIPKLIKRLSFVISNKTTNPDRINRVLSAYSRKLFIESLSLFFRLFICIGIVLLVISSILILFDINDIIKYLNSLPFILISTLNVLVIFLFKAVYANK